MRERSGERRRVGGRFPALSAQQQGADGGGHERDHAEQGGDGERMPGARDQAA